MRGFVRFAVIVLVASCAVRQELALGAFRCCPYSTQVAGAPINNAPGCDSIRLSVRQLFAGDELRAEASAVDPKGRALSFRWFLDDVELVNVTAATIAVDTRGLAPGNHSLEAILVIDGETKDDCSRAWFYITDY
jgi:hypothetical protein